MVIPALNQFVTANPFLALGIGIALCILLAAWLTN